MSRDWVCREKAKHKLRASVLQNQECKEGKAHELLYLFVYFNLVLISFVYVLLSPEIIGQNRRSPEVTDFFSLSHLSPELLLIGRHHLPKGNQMKLRLCDGKQEL